MEYLAQKRQNNNGRIDGAEAENRRARLEIYDTICTFQDHYNYHEGQIVENDIQPPQVTREASSEEGPLVVINTTQV